jgi:hypothetical protein
VQRKLKRVKKTTEEASDETSVDSEMERELAEIEKEKERLAAEKKKLEAEKAVATVADHSGSTDRTSSRDPRLQFYDNKSPQIHHFRRVQAPPMMGNEKQFTWSIMNAETATLLWHTGNCDHAPCAL